MIDNDKIKLLYRYDDHLYNPGELMEPLDTDIRNLNDIVLMLYTRYCKFNFSDGYIYTLDHRDDDLFDKSLYLYELKPLGDILIGNDEYSIDKCNDYIKGLIKTSHPSNHEIYCMTLRYINWYLNNDRGTMSVVVPKCIVKKRIQLSPLGK